MIRAFIFLCLSFQITYASTDVYLFNEGECSLRIPAGKAEEKRKFIRQSSTFTQVVNYIEKPFLDAWNMNDVQAIIEQYEKWNGDEKVSHLAGHFFFPAHILDRTSASYYEQNEAVKLSILLSAKFGYLEARMIAATIFDDARFSSNIRARFKELRDSIRLEIEHKTQNGHFLAIGLILDPIVSTDQVYIRQHIGDVATYVAQDVVTETINARTFLRLGNACWRIGDYTTANSYYEKAALKGSKRAFAEMIHGVIFNEEMTLIEKQSEYKRLFERFEFSLDGYDCLIRAQHFQFGLYDIVDRNLKTTNQLYKKAISYNCVQAHLDYGDFLIASTAAFSQDKAKIKRFYKLAIDSYEKSGVLGKTHGYIKAAETLLHCLRYDFFEAGEMPDALTKVSYFYQKVLLAGVDSLLMEKTREQNLLDDAEFDNLYQHQLQLQNFITQSYRIAFSINLEEVY